MGIQLTTDQEKALEVMKSFLRRGAGSGDYLTLGGYAGTGKTTLLGEYAQHLKSCKYNIAFCALGAKAVNVLKSKVGQYLDEEDFCGTIHKLIYNYKSQFREEGKKRDTLVFEEKEKQDHGYDIIILDEASMVNRVVFNDLKNLCIPILACGDHGQLPPIPHYTMPSDDFSLMNDPDVRLETIVRQALDNPIIRVSQMARETGKIPYGDYDGKVIKTKDGTIIHNYNFKDIDMIGLCGNNYTRSKMNKFAREILHGSDPIPEDWPYSGDRIINLKNDYKNDIFNGDIGVVNYSEPPEDEDSFIELEVDFLNRYFCGQVFRENFYKPYPMYRECDPYNLFDYAYFITVHKFQGSEAKTIFLYEEYMGQKDLDWKRWLYTAVTRAKEQLYIIKKSKFQNSTW